MRAPAQQNRHIGRYRKWRMLGLCGLAIALVIVATLVTFRMDLPSYFALPPSPVAARFIDVEFRHKLAKTGRTKKRSRNVSRFTLTVELRNNTNHKMNAISADMYDKAGYFLFACRIARNQRIVAPNNTRELDCVAPGRLSEAKIESLLNSICEIDLNLTGRSITTKTHRLPWPKDEECA